MRRASGACSSRAGQPKVGRVRHRQDVAEGIEAGDRRDRDVHARWGLGQFAVAGRSTHDDQTSFSGAATIRLDRNSRDAAAWGHRSTSNRTSGEVDWPVAWVSFRSGSTAPRTWTPPGCPRRRSTSRERRQSAAPWVRIRSWICGVIHDCTWNPQGEWRNHLLPHPSVRDVLPTYICPCSRGRVLLDSRISVGRLVPVPVERLHRHHPCIGVRGNPHRARPHDPSIVRREVTLSSLVRSPDHESVTPLRWSSHCLREPAYGRSVPVRM